MSNVNNDIATIMKLMQSQSKTGGSSPNLAAMNGKEGVFGMELSMAQQLFSEPSDNKGFSAGNMDMGVMNNALMLEALTALNSIKGLQSSASTNNLSSQIYNPAVSAAANSPVKKMLSQDVSGTLSAKFESGNKGIAAIGYDRVGGTSYGKYQIASKTGTMDQFIKFLKDKAPQIADKLLSSGPANTGSKGGTMPDVWKKIAAVNPSEFEKLQHDFIKESHYTPAVNMIFEKTGIDMNSLPAPIREVLWSTSVQHGPTGASNLIASAIEKLSADAEGKGFPAELVKEIYGERQGQFSSSTQSVQNSVANRLVQEKNLALAMLGQGLNKTA
ncbi:hypothetical protein [Maridesulfovibrio zosterae]|uniref:VgrG-related protein n=1 Tax=Maridesulfovibrio zosterae TaxID=82171 RepID=UPI00040EEAE2|nr:hypothetical protein [Maridesulfovibrio zosterae]